MQSVHVARYKLTELQPAFSSITAFWQDHNSTTAVLLSLSKAEFKKKKRRRKEKRSKAQILLLCTRHRPLGEKHCCLLTIIGQS